MKKEQLRKKIRKQKLKKMNYNNLNTDFFIKKNLFASIISKAFLLNLQDKHINHLNKLWLKDLSVHEYKRKHIQQ